MEKQNKKHTIAAFIILVIFVAGIAFGVWWYLIVYLQNPNYKSLLKWRNKSTDTEEITTGITTDETADWKTYTDSTYKYSFKYPSDWYLTESTVQSWTPTTVGSGGIPVGYTKIDLGDLGRYGNKKYTNLKTAVDEVVTEESAEFPITVEEKNAIKIGELDVYLVVTYSNFESTSTIYTLYFLKDKELYGISVLTGEIPTEEIDLIIRNIINSFKLI